MSIKKVVVTGGSGRVGRYVIREVAKSFDVKNADLVAGADGIDHVDCDVMDLDKVRAALKGADAVVHLAAIDYDWKAKPEVYIDVNTRGSWHVLQAAAELGLKKAVICSSISACGLSEMRPTWRPQYLQVDESHPCEPVQAYSVSKLIIEEMARSFVNGTSLDVTCLRPMAVILPETLGDYISFIDEPTRQWLFYYITAQDLARAFDLALKASGPRFGVYFASAADTSRPEPTLDWYRQLFGTVPEVTNPRLYELNPRASIFSSRKAAAVLGFEPSSDFLQMRREFEAGMIRKSA